MDRGRVSKIREVEFFPWVLGFSPWVFEFFPWVFENFNLRTCFFLDFWKINQNISKIFPLLKIFGNKNGIFRGNPENLSKRWVFSWVLRIWARWIREVEFFPWVFCLSFVLEFQFFQWSMLKKKPVLRNWILTITLVFRGWICKEKAGLG